MPKDAGTKEPVKQKNKLIYRGLMVLFAIIFIVSVTLVARRYYIQSKAESEFKNLTKTTTTTNKEVTEATNGELTATGIGYPDTPDTGNLAQLGIKVPEKQLDWKALQEKNPDIYAWVYVPGTDVDYPVLQHPWDNNYYLMHNLDGSEGYPGCIFSENLNSKFFDDPMTVLWGHNMKNGTMFTTLHRYEKKDFLEANHYIFIYTPYKIYAYDIFASYQFPDKSLLVSYDFNDKVAFADYIKKILAMNDSNTLIRKNVSVTSDNRILTLETCIGSAAKTKRYIVQGVLLNE